MSLKKGKTMTVRTYDNGDVKIYEDGRMEIRNYRPKVVIGEFDPCAERILRMAGKAFSLGENVFARSVWTLLFIARRPSKKKLDIEKVLEGIRRRIEALDWCEDVAVGIFEKETDSGIPDRVMAVQVRQIKNEEAFDEDTLSYRAALVNDHIKGVCS